VASAPCKAWNAGGRPSIQGRLLCYSRGKSMSKDQNNKKKDKKKPAKTIKEKKQAKKDKKEKKENPGILDT
jgi:hypothetical protein